jgi:hypothetical protein
MTNNKTKLIIISTLIFICSIAATGQTSKDVIEKDNETTLAMREVESENMDVSIVNLICNPKKYHGQTIQIVGYLQLQFEGDAIYLHKEDCEHSLTSNSFWVNFSDKISKRPNLKSYNERYVILIGTFDMNSHGHMGLFAGTLKNIRRLDEWR